MSAPTTSTASKSAFKLSLAEYALLRRGKTLAEIKQKREEDDALGRVELAKQKAEDERKAEEARELEEQRKIEEAHEAEELRKAEEVRKLAEQREAEERQKVEEERKEEVARRIEEEREVAKQREVEEQREIDNKLEVEDQSQMTRGAKVELKEPATASGERSDAPTLKAQEEVEDDAQKEADVQAYFDSITKPDADVAEASVEPAIADAEVTASSAKRSREEFENDDEFHYLFDGSKEAPPNYYSQSDEDSDDEPIIQPSKRPKLSRETGTDIEPKPRDHKSKVKAKPRKSRKCKSDDDDESNKTKNLNKHRTVLRRAKKAAQHDYQHNPKFWR